jgi:hypothetical protein
MSKGVKENLSTKKKKIEQCVKNIKLVGITVK